MSEYTELLRPHLTERYVWELLRDLTAPELWHQLGDGKRCFASEATRVAVIGNLLFPTSKVLKAVIAADGQGRSCEMQEIYFIVKRALDRDVCALDR